jgi:hypothetical protein
LGGTQVDVGLSISIDANGNVYTTGYFNGTADFNPGSGTYNLTSTGVEDIFISKLDASGNFIWALQIGGTSPDEGKSITVDPLGNIYTTGFFRGTADFDPGTVTFNMTSYGYVGLADVFILKLSECIHSTSSLIASTCESYVSPSGNYTWTSSGTYSDTLINSQGCDSVIIIYLTINSTASTITPTACESYLSPSGIYTWTSSGSYTDTMINSQGCDSVITINLTISNTTNTINQTSCESYTSPSGNYIWTSSGSYTDSLINPLGCDSVMIINLTIINSTTSTVSPTACDSFTSPSGNYTWTSSDTYTDTLINSMGCDSVITVNLTVLNNTTILISQTDCDSYTSPSGIYTWTTSGIYSDTLISSMGCDSVITINLTILNSTTNTIDTIACESYTSPSGNFSWSTSGIYTDTLINSMECDSLITINLTIHNSITNTINPTACNSYTSPSGNYSWTSSGSYSDTLINLQGCDSIIFINLTVNTVNIAVTDNSPILSADATGAVYQWIYCDSVPVPGETNQSFTATANGIYAVIVTENGCSDTSECVTINNIYINEYDAGNNIYIYPNPTNGSIIIDLGSENADSEITLINSLGQVVSKRQERSSLINLVIEGGCGLYFVIIRTGDKTFGLKIVKNQ